MPINREKTKKIKYNIVVKITSKNNLQQKLLEGMLLGILSSFQDRFKTSNVLEFNSEELTTK